MIMTKNIMITLKTTLKLRGTTDADQEGYSVKIQLVKIHIN